MTTNPKKYVGSVSTDGTVSVTRVDGSPLPPRHDLFKHASGGFAWGDGGPGAAQLALALLADCLGDEGRALAWHHEFKWYVVARLPAGRCWTLDEGYIRKIVGELGHGIRNRPMQGRPAPEGHERGTLPSRGRVLESGLGGSVCARQTRGTGHRRRSVR